jgi:hypothetical protein
VNGKEPRSAEFSTVVSTVGQIFGANCAILRNTPRKRNDELPSGSNGVQSSETMRNSLGLNYKSAALNQLSYAGIPLVEQAEIRPPQQHFANSQ